ncbi:MAG: FAD:protein FMN transferase [Chitinophagaceae bacterium]|nr:FAD:protein FMN transferase [Chitinophagaceae bacterium]
MRPCRFRQLQKFYIEDGKKYSHIINPFTGYPAKNNLLSATVIADDCVTATHLYNVIYGNGLKIKTVTFRT